MASPLLDVKKFKHVKTDGDTTTLQHDDGHTLTINHKALSKPNQEQLKALSKMSSDAATPSQAKEAKKGRDADVDRQDRPDTGYGKVIYKYDGGGVEPQSPPEGNMVMAPEPTAEPDPAAVAPVKGFFGTKDPSAPEPAQPSADDVFNSAVDKKLFALRQQNYSHLPDDQLRQNAEKSTLDEMAQAKKDQEAAAVAKDKGVANQQAANASSYQRQLADIQAENEKRQALGLSPKPLPVDPNAQAPAPQDGQGIAPAQPEAPAEDPGVQAATSAPKIAVNDAEPKAPTPIAQAPQEQSKQVPAGTEFLNEDKLWQHDLQNGHITPKTYESMFANKSTLGKIGTIFGLMVSSAGAGLSRSPNMLMQMMDKEIQADLEAQKLSKGNAISFNNLAEQHMMDQANIGHMQVNDRLVKDQLAQQAMGRAAFHKLMLQTQAMPEGPMKAQAMQTLGLISQGLDARAVGAADAINSKQALMQSISGNPQGATSEEQFQNQNRTYRLSGHEDLAKDNESKHIPGVPGRASAPLTQEDRSAVNSGVTLDRQLNNFIDWTKKHSGSLNPKEINEGRAMAAGLQGAYRNATNGGVYKASEQDFISKLVNSDPTAFFNKVRVLPQLKAVQNDNRMQLDQHLKSMGFQGYQAGQGQAEAETKVGPDGKNYQSIMQNGKKYWVPVK